ncbi:MAG: cobaltochelatase subunit CobN [Tepidiforma sp.]|nr:cobaltochelatase subunit CobN [Tepidiforma sp.]GIW17827.1 MAG: cobaltochelatase subunit CobN [Tepidiforma sp.]
MTEARPGERCILIVTAYDADLAAIAAARPQLPEGFPAVAVFGAGAAATRRDEVLAAARRAGAAVVRLLAGPDSLGGLFEPLLAACRAAGAPLVVRRAYPMTGQTLAEHSTADPADAERVLQYFLHGGQANAEQALRFLADRYLGGGFGSRPPEALPWEGYFVPGQPLAAGREAVRLAPWWREGRPAVGILFYRNLVQMGETGLIEALAEALDRQGYNALPVWAYGLREDSNGRDNAAAIRALLSDETGQPLLRAVVSLMPFSAARPGAEGRVEAAPGISALDVPVIQGAMTQGSREAWRNSTAGLSPLDVAMSAAMPEIDGRLISVPAGFREPAEGDCPRVAWEPDRLERLAGLAARWARLGLLPNREKRVAILLNNPNGREARLAAAFGLDAPASVIRLLEALRAAGFAVEGIPETGEALVEMILRVCPNDPAAATAEQLGAAVVRVPVSQYAAWLGGLPAAVRDAVESHWGAPPGEVFVDGDDIVAPGVLLGNVFVGPQPQRGFALDRDAILHSPDLPPPHQYLAAYLWLREIFEADAIVQVGKHGNLEWLPGKGTGLSAACFPDIALGDTPLVYPFIMNNPGEGTQAKRRAAAAIVDHLVPPMTEAGSYGELAEARAALEALQEALDRGAGPGRTAALAERAAEAVRRARLERDLGFEPGAACEPERLAREGLHYLDELESGLIPAGLHVLGEVPRDGALTDLLLAIDRGAGERSLGGAIARRLGLAAVDRLPEHAAALAREVVETAVRCGPGAARRELAARLAGDDPVAALALEDLALRVLPAIRRAPDEVRNVVRALEGRAVPPGPAGAPTRGQADALPTGRNFYALDPRTLPSRHAWQTGRALAEAVIARHLDEEEAYPDSVAIIAWGTANIRTRGEDVAQALHLLGVEPEWDDRSGRVAGLRVVPLERLGRPRIDVVFRASGFFRDSFAAAMDLVDEAVCTVAALDEPPERNFVRKHVLADLAQGVADDEARYRVFAPPPGAYVDGVAQAVEAGAWETRRDLAEVYAAWVDHAYTRARYGQPARAALIRRASELSVVLKTRDNEEHDVFDTDDYFQDFGAMAALAQELGGARAKAWIGDTTRPWRAAVRGAEDEARRTFRRRVLNPKWLEGMERHGYQGGSEMLKTVEYAFGFDATAGVLEDWMYERLAEAYVLDARRRDLLARHNPWALRDMASRLLEAVRRGMWQAPPAGMEARLESALLEAEGAIEDRAAAREEAR